MGELGSLREGKSTKERGSRDSNASFEQRKGRRWKGRGEGIVGKEEAEKRRCEKKRMEDKGK